MSFEIISTPDFVRSAQPPSCTIRRGRILLKYKCRWYGVNLIKIDRFAHAMADSPLGGGAVFEEFFVRVHKCVRKFTIVLKKNYLCSKIKSCDYESIIS